MSLEDFESDIRNFYDIHNEAAEEKLLDDVFEYAERVGTNKFAEEVRSIFRNHEESGIGVIYESLSRAPEKWGDFFVEQYKMTFAEAGNAEDAFAVLDSLEEISIAIDTGYGEEIIQILHPYFNHPNDAIRYKSIWYMGDWIGVHNIWKYPQIIKDIQAKLKDTNWKIRCMTKLILEDMESLPVGFELGFFDRMRGNWGSIFEM